MQMANEIGQKYCTTEEAIQEVGVSQATFIKDVRKYGIKKYSVKGRQKYYLKEDIERLRAERNKIRPVE